MAYKRRHLDTHTLHADSLVDCLSSQIIYFFNKFTRNLESNLTNKPITHPDKYNTSLAKVNTEGGGLYDVDDCG